jgi:hypothetical protein
MEKMKGYFSTGQSPQWAVVPVEEEEMHNLTNKSPAASIALL